MTSDACPRSMELPFSRDSEGAQLGFSVPSCSEDPLSSLGGAQAAPPVAKTFSQPSRSRPGALRGHGRVRNALSLGDYAPGMLCKDIPAGMRCVRGDEGEEEGGLHEHPHLHGRFGNDDGLVAPPAP